VGRSTAVERRNAFIGKQDEEKDDIGGSEARPKN
jgi:hypothetical protein